MPCALSFDRNEISSVAGKKWDFAALVSSIKTWCCPASCGFKTDLGYLGQVMQKI